MQEAMKVQEAAYFLSRMRACIQNRREFEFNLSAFLAAARSVVQYGLREAKAKDGGRTWYDSYVTSKPILAFFKDKRDISIHEQLVQPTAHEGVSASDSIMLSESVVVVTRDVHRNVVERLVGGGLPAATPPAPEPGVVRYSYRFTDWPDREHDLLELSAQYLAALERFVADGQARGYLSA